LLEEAVAGMLVKVFPAQGVTLLQILLDVSVGVACSYSLLPQATIETQTFSYSGVMVKYW
jgi:hypothetical protein